MISGSSQKDGYTTLTDVLAVIVTLIFLITIFSASQIGQRERARRVNCLSNMNGLWKSLSAWGLTEEDSFRPSFPKSNITGLNGALPPIDGICPESFVCPTAAGEFGTRPAAHLASVTDSNCNYNYFSGRSDKDGDLVLLADKDGLADIKVTKTKIHWGGNHLGKGGNIVKVAGSGMWVASTNDHTSSHKVIITNVDIIAAFKTNGVVFGH